MKEWHRILVKKEAKQLKRKGFEVEVEKWITPHCRVDIFAKREDETVIVECGFCNHSKEMMKKLRAYATRVIHVPYLLERAYLYPWKINNHWKRAYEKYLEEMDRSHYDWTEQLKDKTLSMNFDWIDREMEKIKRRM